jgi:hypothetical protein
MPDTKIIAAIQRYLRVRHEVLELGRQYPARIGGNDNIIGRIGEFIALRYLEKLGQRPSKTDLASNNPGYNLVDNRVKTQVKVITEENKRGRSVRLRKPWTQFVLVELGANYQCTRIGILTASEHQRARRENTGWSPEPIVSTSMLAENGLIGRYGSVRTGADVAM